MVSNLAKLLSSINSTTFSYLNCTLATPKPAGGGALKRNLTKALPLALIFAATFTLAFLSQRHEAPTNPTNAYSPNNYTLSLSIDKPNLEFSVDATPDGSLKITSHNITLNTNAPQGASIVAKFDDMSLKHANSGEIDPIFASTTSPATLDMNTWGIAVANDVSNATNSMSPNSKYQNSQSDALFATPYELLIYKGTTKTFPVYYGVNINNTIPEGNYSQTVTYTAYTLSNANTSPDNLEITPNIIVNPTTITPITIKTSIKTSKAIDSSAIKVYIKDSPCTSINIVQNYPNNIHLTCDAPTRSAVGGVGKKAITINIPSDKNFLTVDNAIEYIDAAPMQSFTRTDCNNMTQHQVKYLKDTRDNEIYTVSKLKDGKCWMTQNLRLKLNTSTTLTPANTDISSNWTPNRSTESSDGTGGSSNQGSGAAWNGDSEGRKTVRSIYRTPTYSTDGVYYTHSAATAQSANNIDTQGQNAPHSICPKGWRLPTSSPNSGQGEFYNLVRHYTGTNNSWTGSYSGSHTLMQAPASFPLSGYYVYDGYFYAVGSYGRWWSSTVTSSYRAYNLLQRSSYLFPHPNDDRYWGFSVRCVARTASTTVSEITTMQEFTPQMCTNMTPSQTATLRDSRDGEQYTIAKLADNKCWMTQNLRLRLKNSRPLTPADSDVVTTWTVPSGRDTQTSAGQRWDQDPEGPRTVRSYINPSAPNNGTYYTHSAATAQSANNIDTNGQNAPHSICPKGWRLPKTTNQATNSEFYTMAQHYKGNLEWNGSYWSKSGGSHNMLSSPQNFIYSGTYYYDYGSLYDVGSSGNWWSSTANSSTSAYSMYMDSSSIYPRSNDYRYYGFSVRCISR